MVYDQPQWWLPLNTIVPTHQVEYLENEVGWQDPITVKVTHWMALLPGPGRLLFGGKRYVLWGSADPVPRVKQLGAPARGVYAYRITAECTLGNEGLKSARPYAYQLN